mgnify:CR=1 FL=1
MGAGLPSLDYQFLAWLGWVLVPYVLWLAIATSLSWGYVALNP